MTFRIPAALLLHARIDERFSLAKISLREAGHVPPAAADIGIPKTDYLTTYEKKITLACSG